MSNGTHSYPADYAIYNLTEAAHASQGERPSYKDFFATLDEIGIRSSADLERVGEKFGTLISGHGGVQPDGSRARREPAIGRSIVSEVILDAIFIAIRHATGDVETVGGPEIRLVSTSADPDCINTLALLSSNGVVVTDLPAYSRQRDIAYSPKLTYPIQIVEDMIRCRPYLERGWLIVIPSRLELSDSRQGFDFSSSLVNESSQFLRGEATCRAGSLVLEPKSAGGTPKDNSGAVLAPILKVGIPFLKGCPTDVMASIISDELDAVSRMRYVSKSFAETLGCKQIGQAVLRNLFEKIDYEISRLDLDYQRLIRKRQASLGGVLLGTFGLWLCASVPAEFIEAAKALVGTASAAKALSYAQLVSDSEAMMREKDFYVAWKAWKAIS